MDDVTRIGDLSAAPYNPRTITDAQLAGLARSMDAFGDLSGIVFNRRTRQLVGGHQRAKSLPPETAIVVAERFDPPTAHGTVALGYCDVGGERWTYREVEWDETTEKAANVAANQHGGEFDLSKLHDVIGELSAADYDVSLVGFDTDELASIMGDESGILDGADVDEVPPVPATPITKPGDLITLGRHRLLCGDARKAEDVARLMDGRRAGLMNIDPPYGVSYANDDRPNPGVAKPRVAKPRVANDEFRDDELQAFLEAAFRAARDHALTDNAAWYLWHAHLTQGFFAAAAAAADVLLHRQIIWVKPVLLLTRGQYHWKHEPCFMGWVRGHQPPDYGLGNGERTATTVWEVASVSHAEREEFQHSTPKPVGLFDGPIIKHLQRGEIAYDPFAGSGPQFIAAERTGRACYGMDISPAFCDVIVARWEKATGQTAVRP